MTNLRGSGGRTRSGRSTRSGAGGGRRAAAYGLALLLAVTALTLAGPGTPPAVAGPDRPAVATGSAAATSPHLRNPGTAEGIFAVVPGAEEVRAAGPCSGKLARRVVFRTGELRVYKSRRYACAITHAKSPGTPRQMVLSIQAHGGRPVVDRGRYTRQAGPRSVHALNRCVRASGSVGGYGGSTGWILC
ncbi:MULTISPECIES: hypothetical protein [Streptomyces]|uniref:hypothetical protein n=1 Tax=Streptomyces TaxID=1883 RepID=UPI00025CD606|nr:hypothetical protein [Streptomyces tsukubensis NRRL18488]